MFRWIALVTFLYCLPVQSSPHLFNKPADTPQSRYIIDVMTQVYANLGLELRIVEFNHRSSLVAANEGLLDGQLGRVVEVEAQYPNLIRIPVPIFDFSLQLVAKCADCQLDSLEKVVVADGYQAIESYLTNHPFNQQLFKVKSISTQLNLLSQHKVDGALILDFHIPAELKTRYKQEWVFTNLDTFSVYHYIHKKHAPLAAELEKELQRLTDNGTLAQLKAKYQI